MDVLVDLDGTLLDPKPGILGSIQYALRCLGAPVPLIDDLAWAIGPPLRTTFPRLLGGAGRTEEAVALYRENYRNDAMYDAVVYTGIPQALETLSAAAAGCSSPLPNRTFSRAQSWSTLIWRATSPPSMVRSWMGPTTAKPTSSHTSSSDTASTRQPRS